jgi:hypothetical protein
MAAVRSTKKIVQWKKKSASRRKPTQAEIETRMEQRAQEYHEKVRQLELTKIVAEDTMRLQFQPLLSTTYHIEVDKTP